MSHGLRWTDDQFNRAMAQLNHGAKEKRAKYGNKKKVINGLTFDSTKEARRYQDLELQQRSRYITDLRRQVKFPVNVNGVFICDWFADFTYRDRDGKLMVEDTKGIKTDEYRLKKKLVQAIYGIIILET